ncbi:hypothetical protein ACFY0R_17795 [Streptomyces sp. NPDC001633]|uniref:hypothetical protein n=1 Tax=Streptomyces sp. NPDC001633 TaxID=3364595 RepID=UPI0036C34900
MAQVCGDLVAAVLVGVQVVLGVREGRQFEAVPVEGCPYPVGVGLVEVGHVEVGGCCVVGAGGGRGGYLQCLVVVFGGPGCDLVERQAGQACGVETEFHLVRSPCAGPVVGDVRHRGAGGVVE